MRGEPVEVEWGRGKAKEDLDRGEQWTGRGQRKDKPVGKK